METFLALLRLIAIILLALVAGKLLSKIKLPAILGWLIVGIFFGPHAVGLVEQSTLDAEWYKVLQHVLECVVGLMIGTELVWSKLKKTGKQIIVTTLTQSIGTFLVVSAVFALIFYFSGIPYALGFIFGGIALATAPAPALSIVREFRTKGPVTDTLIPMAALDDIVAVIVFFTTVSVIATGNSESSVPAYVVVLTVLLPIVIGVLVGVVAGLILRKVNAKKAELAVVAIMILVSSGIGFLFDYLVMPSPSLNFMLIGMAFSAAFANLIDEEKLKRITAGTAPAVGAGMVMVILNLGMPLDYHYILGAGVYTVVYIVSRAAGKYSGAFLGSAITRAPKTVRNYLGLTLLPHSGVSLVFTGIAVGMLSSSYPEGAQIIQGTICAAAIINEIIAVIVSKKAFKWAGELNGGGDTVYVRECSVCAEGSDRIEE